jgi:hypothetical protein
MNTRIFLFCSLTFGCCLFLVAQPALALTENGRSLLDDLRSKVGKSTVTSSLETEMPRSTQPDPSRPKASPAPSLAPTPAETASPVDPVSATPTPSALSTLPDNPSLEESNPDEPKPKDSPAKKAKKPAKSESQGSDASLKGPAATPAKAKSADLPSQNGRMGGLVQNLREKLENRDHDHSPGSQIKESGKPRLSKPEPISPRASPVSPPVTVAPVKEEVKTMVADAAPPSKGGGPRSFAELTDEELIQYAEEHVWSSEKSRKHHPPPTPPYRPKKKKGETTASTKSDATVKKTPAAPVTKTPVKKAKSSKKTS